MNERIKELIKQALKHPDNDNDGLTVFDNDELKKFAELIVQECISILYTERGSTHGSERDFAIVNAALKIQRHFEAE